MQGGNKNSGRKGHGLEKAFWDKLDKALPTAVDACIEIIEGCQLNLINKNLTITESKGLQDTILKACQVLMSKAPQRIAGTGEDGAIVLEIKDSQYGSIIKRENDKAIARAVSANEEGGSQSAG